MNGVLSSFSNNSLIKSCLIAIIAVMMIYAPELNADDTATSVTPPRDHSMRITQSVLNELWTAADTGRRFILSRSDADGHWKEEPAAASAFIEDDGSLVKWGGAEMLPYNVEHRLNELLRVPTTRSEILEIAGSAQFLKMIGSNSGLIERAAKRLASIDLADYEISNAAFILLARGLVGASATKPYEWGIIISKANEANEPNPGIVALAGLARMARGLNSTGSAVRAHVRWIKRNVWLFSDNVSMSNEKPSIKDLWWIALFLDSVPPAVLHEEKFPLDWRMKMAGYIISGQRRIELNGVSAGVWMLSQTADFKSKETISETVYAVKTLIFISQ